MSELLIVGGLTIDRFADGRSAPGGSVLHAGLAAVEEGAAVTFLTVAGDDREALEGPARLQELGTLIHQPAASTTNSRHDESDGRRGHLYGATTAMIDPTLAGESKPARVALLAPIADELSAAGVDTLRAVLRPACTVLLIQRWLRRLDLGSPVHP